MYRFSLVRQFCKLLLVAGIFLAGLEAPVLAQCNKHHQDVEFKDGIGRIRTYECSSGDTSVRVVFHRLQEEIVGDLLLGTARPEVQKTMGDFTLIKNRVYSETAELFARFGVEETVPNLYSVELRVPRGGTEYTNVPRSIPPGTPSTRIFSLAPNGAKSHQDSYFKFPGKLVGQGIFDRIKEAHSGGRLFNFNNQTPTPKQLRALKKYYSDECTKKNDCAGKRYMDLARYIGSKAFLQIAAQHTCNPEDGLTGLFWPRELILDLAIVQNTSDQDITIDAVIGAPSIQAMKLAPGKAIGIPIKMVFVAFAGPKPISYGPRLKLKGLKLNGRRLLFQQMSSNFLGVTSGESGASCPYLYALKPDGSPQQSYGKVIHAANGRYREMTEVVQLKEFATRFMLREEEPERSYIDQVQLRLRMKDKSYLRFAPKNPTLAIADATYTEIAPYTALQISFELPKWIKPENVERATLAITGYYERVLQPGVQMSSSAAARN